MTRKLGLVLAVLLVAVGMVTMVNPRADADATTTTSTTVARADTRPNIVMVLTDDQTYEAMRVLPKVKKLLGDQGVTFTKFFTSYPLCCPSRTTYYTGQLAHNHHVTYNEGPTGGFHAFKGQNTTFPVALQKAGYTTIHIGKYLNGYGKHVKPRKAPIPPGWTDWNGSIDPSTYRYYDFTLNQNGKPHRYKAGQYQTTQYTDLAVSKIQAAAQSTEPFFLDFAVLAPHAVERETSGLDPEDKVAADESRVRNGIRYSVPEPKYRKRFLHTPLPKDPSFDEADVDDKPINIRFRPRFTEREIQDITTGYRKQLQTLQSVDDAVQRIVRTLRTTGQLDNTVILFMSDNGFFYGEHRIPFGKYLPYDSAIHVPLIIRGPGFAKGAVSRALTYNADIAPTILQIAGVAPLRPPDGRSLVPVLQQPTTTVHRAIVLESGRNNVNAPVYQGIRTQRYKYLAYADTQRELYDLKADPYELHNVYGVKRYAKVQHRLAKLSARSHTCAGSSCP